MIGLVFLLHDAEFEQQGLPTRSMVIGVGIVPLPALAWILPASWRYSSACLDFGSYSSTVMRRSSACCTTLSRGHEVDQLGAQAAGQRFGQFQFLVGLALVADQPAEAHAAGIGVLQNALGDVVGGVHRHHLAGHHDVDFLRLVLANRHGETAAHHVAQHVVGNIVHAVVSTVLFEEVDRGDNATTGTTHARLRTTGFDAADVAVTDAQHVFQLQVFHATGFGSQRQHGVLCLGVQDQAGGVGLGVATDDEDFLPHLGQRGQSVLGSGRFADTTLAVKGDLS